MPVHRASTQQIPFGAFQKFKIAFNYVFNIIKVDGFLCVVFWWQNVALGSQARVQIPAPGLTSCWTLTTLIFRSWSTLQSSCKDLRLFLPTTQQPTELWLHWYEVRARRSKKFGPWGRAREKNPNGLPRKAPEGLAE